VIATATTTSPSKPKRLAAVSPDTVLTEGLQRAARRVAALDVPVPPLEGKLLRPRFALAMVPRDRWSSLDDRFWCGALAIQMVHEASLLHDDVIDAASERRGEPTLAASLGAGPAVVLGDRYLTGAYRAAALTGSFPFLERFTEAVEKTVAGEVAQGEARGRMLGETDYDRIISGKSGELFGVAALLGSEAAVIGDAREQRQIVGRAFGNFYQRIDDLLDYCHVADTGKPPLQDYRQGKWSWVLDLAAVDRFDLDEGAILDAVFTRRSDAPSAARQALEILKDRRRKLLREALRCDADETAFDDLLLGCVDAAERGIAAEEASRVREAASRTVAAGGLSPGRSSRAREEAHVRSWAKSLGGPREWSAYFGEHARTFHLAARLFPPREAGLVAGLYAYCRFTDDLVDDPHDTPTDDALGIRLELWREWSMAAFDGQLSGIPVVDIVLSTAAQRGVSRIYPDALIDGVAMDLAPRAYATWADLERYTFGVAGAVGGWLCQLFDIHDPDLLERAHALGHGMQLTNIARDVGEDLERGRVYLPTELLDAHQLTAADIAEMARGERPVSDAYRAAVRDLLTRAEGYYDVAWPGIRELPGFFRRPVAAAAAAYRGIHREIRRNGYDNLTQRAYTSLGRKLYLAGTGLLDARRAT
jgi:phytoene synthase